MKKTILLLIFVFFQTKISFADIDLALVQVSNLEDLNTSYVSGINTADKIVVNNFCVASLLNGRYKIAFTSSNGTGRTFRVKSAANNYIPYYLTFYPAASATGISYSATSGNTISTRMNNGRLLVIDCLADNDTISITFLQSDLDAAIAGTYSDVLTVYIVPN